jgi:hypothetical protein
MSMTLEQRVRVLEDIQEISELKAAYGNFGQTPRSSPCSGFTSAWST